VTLLLATALFLWLFWYAYILVMGLYRAHLAKRLTPFTYALALPALAIGYLMDVFANVTIASVAFLEPPREWLVTDRLQRHMHKSKGWRFWLAKYICDHLLDVFDPSGDHC
jgi:hypothetical protein